MQTSSRVCASLTLHGACRYRNGAEKCRKCPKSARKGPALGTFGRGWVRRTSPREPRRARTSTFLIKMTQKSALRGPLGVQRAQKGCALCAARRRTIPGPILAPPARARGVHRPKQAGNRTENGGKRPVLGCSGGVLAGFGGENRRHGTGKWSKIVFWDAK